LSFNCLTMGPFLRWTVFSTGVLAATSHGVFSSSDGMTWSASSTGITNLNSDGTGGVTD